MPAFPTCELPPAGLEVHQTKEPAHSQAGSNGIGTLEADGEPDRNRQQRDEAQEEGRQGDNHPDHRQSPLDG